MNRDWLVLFAWPFSTPVLMGAFTVAWLHALGVV
jgi:hypothetical protein